MIRRAVLLALISLWTASGARGATLEVGPLRRLALPSDAAQIARDGDLIRIDPGEYVDCAVWRAHRLRIEGSGPGVVLRGKVCGGKGIFVTAGDDITVANLTFAEARAPAGNGAGIRAEGRNLTVANSRFVANENGILAAASPDSTIRINGSEFRDNGSCAQQCAHGIYIGHVAAVLVEGSRFYGTREGHHLKSRARRTEIVGNVIVDGPRGSSSYLIDIPNGGVTLIEGNRMEKGPRSDNPAVAVSIGAEGVSNPTPSITVRSNSFINRQSVATVFVRNLAATDARLSGNELRGDVAPLEGPGSVR